MKQERKSRKQPLVFITTNTGSGAAQGTPAWKEHIRAIRVCEGRAEDDRYFALVYELDKNLDDEIFDRRDLWPAFNPSLPDTPSFEYLDDQVKASAASPSRKANVLRLNFGRWADAANPWLDPAAWKACQHDKIDPSIYEGIPCMIGLDLSQRADISGSSGCLRYR